MAKLKKGSRCTVCKAKGEKEKAVVFLPHHRLALCKKHYIEWFEKRVAKTVKEFRMFSPKDKILVAVSGGKDSLALWNALVKLGYEADGFYIDLGIDEYSQDSKRLALQFAERIERPLHIVSLKEEIAPIPQIDQITNRPACSACGTVKRYYMNKYAKELGYNIIATGHNLDDEVAVLFGNTLHWDIDYLKRQYPVLKEENGFIRKVKPLCKITEKEAALYAFFNNIEYIEYECPFSEGASSIEYKELFSQLEEKHPGTKLQFYTNFLKKMYPILKEHEERQKQELQKCKICGEPSFSEICSVCKLKEKVKTTVKSE
ncbi:TIGR00269 family protein [Persephonella sp. IF05-L8]|uniref:TIGR00269 family protein n=1 Tax=Persephonella sp. IF05-L8 TaxID=1158338 RepID=UPI0004977911